MESVTVGTKQLFNLMVPRTSEDEKVYLFIFGCLIADFVLG